MPPKSPVAQKDPITVRREHQQARTHSAAAASGALSHPFLSAELPYKVNALPGASANTYPAGRVGLAHSLGIHAPSNSTGTSSSSSSLSLALHAKSDPPSQRRRITPTPHQVQGSGDSNRLRTTMSNSASSTSTSTSNIGSSSSSRRGLDNSSSSRGWSTGATTPATGSSSGSGAVASNANTSSTTSSGFGPGLTLSPLAASSSAQSSASSLPPARPASHFESLMGQAHMPAPGLSYYNARRALWLDPPPIPPTPASPSPSRVKLETLLNQPGAVESEEVWRAGLKNVWKGLVGGNQLRKRLTLSIVLKILQAGWLRDGTWPEGAVAPSWDDQQSLPSLSQQSSYTTYASQQQQQQQHPQYQSTVRADGDDFSTRIPSGYTQSSGDQSGAQSQAEGNLGGHGTHQHQQSHAYPYSQPTPPPLLARPPLAVGPLHSSPPPASSPQSSASARSRPSGALLGAAGLVMDGGDGDDDDDDDDEEEDMDADVEEPHRRHPSDSRHEGG